MLKKRVIIVVIVLNIFILLATMSACRLDKPWKNGETDNELLIDKTEDPIDNQEKFYKLAYSKAVLATFAKRDDDIAIKVSTLDQLNGLVNNKDSIIFKEIGRAHV